MADYRPYQDLSFGFAKLFEDLSAGWASRDLDLLRELVAQGEYGEALENLLALADSHGKSLSPAQAAAVAALCAKMGMSAPAGRPKMRQGAGAGPGVRAG